jgi:hypothetical protein
VTGGGAAPRRVDRFRYNSTLSKPSPAKRPRVARLHENTAAPRGDRRATGAFPSRSFAKSSRAPHADQARRFQVVRRPHDDRDPRTTRRNRRSQRLRQVQRDRRRALGARRIEGLRTARGVDAGRDLQRCGRTQARRPRVGRTAFRQQPGAHRRPVGQVCGDFHQARVDARRRFLVLHQQYSRAAPRHPRPLPRHGAGAACLRDHRAGDDLARDRGEAGGAADLPRGSRGRFQVQGTPQGDRGPSGRHARESGARRGHPHRVGQPARAPRPAGAGRDAVPRARGAAEDVAALVVVREAAGRRPRAGEVRDGDRRAYGGARGHPGRDPRRRSPARSTAHRPLRGGRRAARAAGRVLRGQRGGDAARAAACVRARVGDAHHAAGRAADRGAGRARRTGSRARGRPRWKRR